MSLRIKERTKWKIRDEYIAPSVEELKEKLQVLDELVWLVTEVKINVEKSRTMIFTMEDRK